MTHDYSADPQSGAGNCICGAAMAHRRHPHTFRRVRGGLVLCVCGLAHDDAIHRKSHDSGSAS